MTEKKPNKKAKSSKLSHLYASSLFKVLFSALLFALICSSAIVLYYYNYYSKVIDRKLSGEIFKNTAQIYAAPYRIYPGQKLSAEDAVLRLQRAGFDTTDKGSSEDGVYEVSGNKIIIRPKTGDAMRLDFAKNSLVKIQKVPGGETDEAWL